MSAPTPADVLMDATFRALDRVVPCVSSTDVRAFADDLADRLGPDWKDDPKWRSAIDMLLDASDALATLEHARHPKVQEAAARMAAKLMCPPALDDDEPIRLAKAGAL